MQPWLWTLVGFVAYIMGVILIVKVTPRLPFCAYDDIRFMALAVLDIIGALLVFGGIVIQIAEFNEWIVIKIFNLILLVFLVFLAGRMAVRSFRSTRQKTYALSRYAAGIFCVFLLLSAIFYIVQMFKVL
jgi:hypothetical protein